jgi:hypothetical protein
VGLDPATAAGAAAAGDVPASAGQQGAQPAPGSRLDIALVRSAAPPQMSPAVGGTVWLVGLGIAILFVIVSIPCFVIDLGAFGVAFIAGALLTVVATGIMFGASSRQRQREMGTFPKRMEQWQRTWVCLKCGHRFMLVPVLETATLKTP